jgi:hypothetical protein
VARSLTTSPRSLTSRTLTGPQPRAPAAGANAGTLQRVCHTLEGVSPTWIWMQVAIVLFVAVGAVIAIVKLA